MPLPSTKLYGVVSGLLVALLSSSALAAAPPTNAAKQQPDVLSVQAGSDIPARLSFPGEEQQRDYLTREVMIPMRDGVKLYTVLVLPKNTRNLPMVLTRTPYHAKNHVERIENALTLREALSQGDDVFADGGYIRVFQDIRGKYDSQGDYVMARPPRGPLNPTKTDETTDAWDTINWLIHNVPETNGRVGMIGSSYEGFTVVMALLDPHPALKVAAPESPMVDGWMGDDWFHYGVFRQASFDYFKGQMSSRRGGDDIPRKDADDYTNFLNAGSAGAFAQQAGLDQYPFWNRVHAHPAYDIFWQAQALDKLLADKKPTVPMLWEQGLWDQEDMWGAIHSWQAIRGKDLKTPNTLVMGPWRHSGVNGNGSSLGPLEFSGDTAYQYRHDVLRPFFDTYLKPGSASVHLLEAIIYNTAEQKWDYYRSWPQVCENECGGALTPLYLSENHGLSFKASEKEGADSYVSDPAHPVPFLERPFAFSDRARWKSWLVQDQRNAEARPDVVTYQTEVLDAPVRVSGVPVADLFAQTTGTDVDWVVKLIDVQPAMVPDNPKMGGYELPISMDIFRGRYRNSFEKPEPVKANATEHYHFTLPAVNHVFAKGHRIMVQIQSSWFPLYERNPQKYVPNIFDAKPEDYITATQTLQYGGKAATSVLLPVVQAGKE